MNVSNQPWDIDKVTEQDLIRELSPAALDYYANITLSADWPHYERATDCKFVRLGTVIYLGSVIPFGERAPAHSFREGRRARLLHRDIAYFALSQEPPEKVQAIADTMIDNEKVLSYQFMVDAGHAGVVFGGGNSVKSLILGGDSFDFGRADETGRSKTLRLAQAILGDNVEVILGR